MMNQLELPVDGKWKCATCFNKKMGAGLLFFIACALACVHVCMCACVRACMRACVRACMQTCMDAWTHVGAHHDGYRGCSDARMLEGRHAPKLEENKFSFC